MNFGTPHLRKLLRRYREATQNYYLALGDFRTTDFFLTRGLSPPPGVWQPSEPVMPEFPAECEDMRCGAKNRKGGKCRNKSIYSNGRCKFHGGLSTGPKTSEGKAKSALNSQQRKCHAP